MCDCIFSQTTDLRWKMGKSAYFLPPTLEQAWICKACGTIDWREVPFVHEEEDAK